MDCPRVEEISIMRPVDTLFSLEDGLTNSKGVLFERLVELLIETKSGEEEQHRASFCRCELFVDIYHTILLANNQH